MQHKKQLPPILHPQSRLTKWLFKGVRLDDPQGPHHTRPWYHVLWLTGVDYFSTLGYQPGIALLAAGALSPVATLFLIVVTLFGALPIYKQVAQRSYAGQGSIAMLENLLPGWRGKFIVLVLLGFASTDFIITMTLSSADAALHLKENPLFEHFLAVDGSQIFLTILFLSLLTFVFLKGFKEAIGVAAVTAIPYLILNAIVLGRSLYEVFTHPEYLDQWRFQLDGRGGYTQIFIFSALAFPRLALGLSGFETGVTVMPLVRDRIRGTKSLLTAAAIIMSVMLLLSSFCTALLIPESSYQEGGKASGRAIAYLAHEYFGIVFGSFYDVSTILILWFAGASAMAGMLNLIPRFLPRFGLAPYWAAHSRPLVLVLFAITVVITLIFKADVEAQAGAYATGVLVLILSAGVAVSLALWKEDRKRFLSLYFWLVSLVFAYTLLENVIDRPDGVIIGGIFVFLIILLSVLSRSIRSTELRVSEIQLADDQSSKIWESIRSKKIHLVPTKHFTREARARKAAQIRKFYNIEGPIAFVHVQLLDNRTDFVSPLHVKVEEENGDFTIEVSRAIAIANSLAYISELLDPKSIFLELTRRNLFVQAIRFIVWGEGETALLVYAILLKFWELTPEDDVRPLIFLMSD